MKIISCTVLVTGMLIALTGIAHISMTPGVNAQMQQDPSLQALKDKVPGFVYFFVLAGASFLFAGLLIAFSASRLKRKETWAWIIAAGSSVFVACGSIPAILYAKFGNPLIYLDVICASLNVILLIFSIKAFNWHPQLMKHT